MTKEEFISSIEARPTFIKWATTPSLTETIGDVEKWVGVAFIKTADGVNTHHVWFMVDKATGEANWQSGDTLNRENNTNQVRQKALLDYLEANYPAFFVDRVDLERLFASATVYTVVSGTLKEKRIMVYKRGADPITEIDIV